MQLRTVGTNSSSSEEDNTCPQYDGITNVRKLKSFIFCDLMTYYTYRRFSLQFFSSGSKNDTLYLESIKKVSKNIAHRYIGTNSGTPANQLSKRVDNLIMKFFNKESHFEGSGASNVSLSNKEFYSNSLNPGSKGPFIAVKLKLDNSIQKSIITHNEAHSYDSIYVDLGDACRWIIDNFMIASREEDLLQCIMKKQYDLIFEIFSSFSDVPEEVKIDIVRRYLALECVLFSEPGRLGDRFELILETNSFNVLIPEFIIPPVGDNLLIIKKKRCSSPDIKPCSSIFSNIQICNGYIHNCDLELSIYKSRISMDFGKFDLLIIQDDDEVNVKKDVVSILKKIGWSPDHLMIISDSDRNNPFLEAAVIYKTGIGRHDAASRSIIMSVYRDILTIGYSEASDFFQSIIDEEDNIVLLKKISDFVSNREVDRSNLYSILTSALVVSISDMKTILDS